MLKNELRKRILYVAAILVFVTGISYNVCSHIGCGTTSNAAIASELLYDRFNGNKMINEMKVRANPALKQVWVLTNGINCLDYTQAARLAVILPSIDTPFARAFAVTLWRRQHADTTNVCETGKGPGIEIESRILPKCVGAYSLARCGLLKRIDEEDFFLTSAFEECMSWTSVSITAGLVVLTCGLTQDNQATSFLESRIDSLVEDNAPVVIADACGLHGDLSLAPGLRRVLRQWTPRPYKDEGDRYLDYGPRVLRALILLEQYDSIDIFLERLAHSENEERLALECLVRLTGAGEQRDIVEWSNCRHETGTDFKLSETCLTALRQEVILDAESWLLCFYAYTGNIYHPLPFCFQSLSEIREQNKGRFPLEDIGI